MLLPVDLEGDDGDGDENHPLPQDLIFAPWLTLSSDLEQAMGPVFQVAYAAMLTGDRKPRRDLMAGIHAIVSAIIANLVILHQAGEPGVGIAVNLRNKKRLRYDCEGFRKLPTVINALEAAGLLHVTKAVIRKRRTTITPTNALRRLLTGTTMAGIKRVEGEEMIQLVARPEKKVIAGVKQPKLLTDYEDTLHTHAMRAEMSAINSFIASHEVELVGSPQAPIRLYRRFTLRRPDDPPAFDLHGRLYGGFWMTLKATERHRLRIDGEPVADLDFAGMFPQLAYARIGLEAPPGDLYAIPGLEQHRDGAKAAFSALLSYASEMKSLPSRVKEKLPQGWTASRVKQAFAANHPAMVPLFGRDIGLDLMFTESRILMSAMRRLREAGIMSLPMHDGLMVQCSKSEEAKRAMVNAAEEVIGRVLPVALKV